MVAATHVLGEITFSDVPPRKVYRAGWADAPLVTCDVGELRWREGLTLCVLALLCVGVLAVESAAANVGLADAADLWLWSPSGRRHALFAGLAVMAFWVGSRPGVGRLVELRWAAWAAAVVGVMVCVAALVPGVGVEVNGARRWLALGSVQVQASEVAKWAAVVWLGHRATLGVTEWRALGIACGPVAAIIGLIAVEDFGTAALVATVAAGMLIAGGARLWQLALLALPVMAAGAWLVAGTPYRWARLTSFLDPWADPAGSGFHMTQALASFATGPLGTGLGNGVQKQGFLPEDTTDFIFAVIAEETGIVGAVLVVALYLLLLLCGWHATRTAGGPLWRMLAFGVTATVGLQAAINLAVATVSVPTKGMSLPLISFGGSGLLLTGLMLGLLCGTMPRRETNEREGSTE